MAVFSSPTMRQPEGQSQVQQQFQPRWDEKTLRSLLKEYHQNPAHYPAELKEQLQEHASY